MTDDTNATGGQDRKRINLDDKHELRHWAQELDMNLEQIKEAVQAVGDQADEVELHLKGTRSTTNADTTERGELESLKRESERPERPSSVRTATR